MSIARYLSKLGAFLNSNGQVQTAGVADANITAAKLATGAARSNFGAGAVLQVVQASTTTVTGTTSTTYADVAGLAASITPSSASSKILVLVDYSFYIQSDNSNVGGVQIVRNATVLVKDTKAAYDNVNANVAFGCRSAFNYLDSPNTTSAITYKVQIARESIAGTGYSFQVPSGASSVATITLMEIAG